MDGLEPSRTGDGKHFGRVSSLLGIQVQQGTEEFPEKDFFSASYLFLELTEDEALGLDNDF